MLDDDLRARTELILVSVDDRERQRLMVERVRNEYGVELDMTILADPGHAVIDRYGLFNADSSERRPVPHPTTLIIDRNGIVRWRYTETDYRIRPSNGEILAALMAAR